MKDFCLKVWSVTEYIVLLQCTIKVVHYNTHINNINM